MTEDIIELLFDEADQNYEAAARAQDEKVAYGFRQRAEMCRELVDRIQELEWL